jgi:hypothetical protein
MDEQSGKVTPSEQPHAGDVEHDAVVQALREREKFAIEQECRREASHRDHPVHHAPFHLGNEPQP